MLQVLHKGRNLESLYGPEGPEKAYTLRRATIHRGGKQLLLENYPTSLTAGCIALFNTIIVILLADTIYFKGLFNFSTGSHFILFCIGIGVLIFAFKKKIVLVDKKLNFLKPVSVVGRIFSKNLINPPYNEIYALEAVRAIRIVRTKMRFFNAIGLVYYFLLVYEIHIVTDGRFSADYVISQDRNADRAQEIANRIGEFLNIKIIDETGDES